MKSILKKSESYQTWQEAGRATKALGIRTWEEYEENKLYKKDPRLPSRPDLLYKDFPGFAKFVGRTTDPHCKEHYKTWQEVVLAAIRVGISTTRDYDNFRFTRDPLLPYKALLYKYPGFPGFPLSKALKSIRVKEDKVA